MRFLLPCVLAASVVGLVAAGAVAADWVSWPSAGHDIADTHSQPAEARISPPNVGDLTPRWTFTTNATLTTFAASPVSVSSTVDGNTVYFPDWGGWLYALD